jgi:MIP family channel proteins
MVQSNTRRRREKRTEDAAEPEEIIPLCKRLLAELIGTFALVFAAVGSDAADIASGYEIGKFAIAAAPGLVVTAMTYAVDKICGAYFNPAVTIGFALTGHLKLRDLPLYIIVQAVGAVVASAVVFLAIVPPNIENAGLTLPRTGWLQSFALELVLTFFLMFIGISLKERVGYKPFGGIAIGAFIAAAGIIGIPVSGGSMNPARSFGPALVSLNLSYEWVYWIAPTIGAILAVLCFRAIKHHRAEGIGDGDRDDKNTLSASEFQSNKRGRMKLAHISLQFYCLLVLLLR